MKLGGCVDIKFYETLALMLNNNTLTYICGCKEKLEAKKKSITPLAPLRIFNDIRVYNCDAPISVNGSHSNAVTTTNEVTSMLVRIYIFTYTYI